MPAELTPPNRTALWSKLSLTTTQLADLCGVTTRQIAYWARKGYIGPSGAGDERYHGDAIDRVVLIKQGLDHGLPLRRAVRLAEETLAAQQVTQPGLRAIEPASLQELRDQLRGAQANLSHVLGEVAALLPRERAVVEGKRHLEDEAEEG